MRKKGGRKPEGRNEGRNEGRKEGREGGREEGRKEGRKNERKKTILMNVYLKSKQTCYRWTLISLITVGQQDNISLHTFQAKSAIVKLPYSAHQRV